MRSLGLSCYRHLNQLLNNKGHWKRKGNHFKILSPTISSSEVVGMEGKKDGATVGEKKKKTSIFAGFSTSTKLFFSDLCSGRHWIQKLTVGYKPSIQLEHTAEWNAHTH